MREFLKKWDLSAIYQIALVILDVCFINLCSVAALLVRFELSAVPVEYWESVRSMMIPNTIVTIGIFTVCRLYRSLWRFASAKELLYIGEACIGSFLFNAAAYFLTYKEIYRSYFVIYTIGLFLCTCIGRFSYRFVRMIYRSSVHSENVRRTMIVGAGEACNVVMKELEMSKQLDAKICCIIDDDPRKAGTYIHGVKVVGGRDKILENVEKYKINEIILAMPSAKKKEIQAILGICKNTDADLKILPGVYQLVNGDVSVQKLRNVEIEDLLGREPIDIKTETIERYVYDKVVLVTGGGGSIGSELCRQIAANGVKRLIIFDIYENNAYDIQQELKHKYPDLDLVVLIGSVRNSRKINSVFAKYRPDIVYHAAAHKHVPLMEDSPNEAVKNNVVGTWNVAKMADKYGVGKFVMISTDKAVNPTNVMGATKRICEMIIQSYNERSRTDFVAVRFGNVLGSNGSVIPLFKKQIEAGGPVTVTDPNIIRYFMTIPEAVSLVLQAGAYAKGGEIFILDMGEPVKIDDLAKNLIRLSGYTLGVNMEIKYTGLRPGEKLYEELLMKEEGLQDTANKLIHIGKPIEFDKEHFFEHLEELKEEAYAETGDIRTLIQKVAPTYHPKEN